MLVYKRIILSGLVACLLGVAMLSSVWGQDAMPDPPFEETRTMDPDIITLSDPSALQTISYEGISEQVVFDGRRGRWVVLDVHLIAVQFDDNVQMQFQVNPEFEYDNNDDLTDRHLVNSYIHALGRLPTDLRQRIDRVWVHKGDETFRHGRDGLLIHTGRGAQYIEEGILEETLAHEAIHISLDPDHARGILWQRAQAADNAFISDAAQEFPFSEDFAESFLAYLALRYRPERISPAMRATINETIPNRIAYLDDQLFALSPYADSSNPPPEPVDTPTPASTPAPTETPAAPAPTPSPPETSAPQNSGSDCVIPPSGPWPPCATNGSTPANNPPNPPANGGNNCVIPPSGPWPPCATNGGGPYNNPPNPPTNSGGDCVIPPSGPWPPCAR